MEQGIERIGKYDIVSILGQGAVSVVYKGFDPIIERYVAIKTIRKDPVSPEMEELRHRFIHEAKAAGRFHHPNIVSVFDCGEDAGQTYIVMEFVDGNPLSTYLWKQHQFSLEEIRNIIVKVLEALDYAHSMDVVHRDIKPSNVMLSKNGEVKIADFGIARLDSSTLTRVGMVIGTPSYMSPEQLLGKRVDHRTDLYAAGLLLYELLTRKRVFEGSDPNALMYQVVNGAPIPPRSICSEIPAGFDPIIEKALAKLPGERFRTGKEFIEAIDQVFLVRPDSKDPDKNVLCFRQGRAYDRLSSAVPHIQPVESGEPDSETALLVKTPDGKITLPYRRKGLLEGMLFMGIAILAVMSLVVPRDMLNPFIDGLYALSGLVEEVSGAAKSPEVIAKHEPDGTRPREDGAVDPFKQGKVVKDCPLCPERLVVPPGKFMQSLLSSETKSQSNEGPQRPVETEFGVALFNTSETVQSRTKPDHSAMLKSQAWERLRQYSKRLESSRSYQADKKTPAVLAGFAAEIGKGGTKNGGFESSSPKSSEKIAEGLMPASLPQGRQATAQCYKLGPFSAKEPVERLTVELAGMASWFSIVSDPIDVPSGFWVLHPPGDDFQASRANYESFKARGVEEIWLFSTGKLRGFISMGLFASEPNAVKELARLKEMGINGADVRPWTVKEFKHWLHFGTSEEYRKITKRVEESIGLAGLVRLSAADNCQQPVRNRNEKLVTR